MEKQSITEEKTIYLSCSETAKLLRNALKKAFPKQKFSVRSNVYSGGASIDVSWENGVAYDPVNKICKLYAGAGFDGMIDLKFYKDHWMMPDGTIHYGSSEGTTCCAGVYDSYKIEKPHPDAKKVSFGADFVFAQREITEDVMEKTAKTLAEHYKITLNSMQDYPKQAVFNGLDNWYCIARSLLWNKDLSNGTDIVPTDCEAGQIEEFWEVKQ